MDNNTHPQRENSTKKPTLPPTPFISIRTTKRLVLKLLSEGGNAHSIAKELQLNKATVVEHLQSLQKLGLTKKGQSIQINNNRYGDVWSITDQGTTYLRGGFSLVEYERGGVGVTEQLYSDEPHNIKIKFEIKEKPTEQDLIAFGWIPNDKIRNNVFYRKRFGEYLTTYTGKSLIVQLPRMKKTFEPDIAIAEAGRIAMLLKDQYEKEIPGMKLGKYSIKPQLISQEHAIPNHPFAEKLVQNGITYQGKISSVDASTNCSRCGSKVPETEFKGKDSHIHVKELMDFTDDIALNPSAKMSEIVKTIKLQGEMILEQNKTNSETAEGLLGVVKFLESQVKKPNETVKNFKTRSSDFRSYIQ
jgi:DNA-binding transcriptional ArsR family regulator